MQVNPLTVVGLVDVSAVPKARVCNLFSVAPHLCGLLIVLLCDQLIAR